nr:MAG TPA: integrase [Caudoviricetes sp.]
MEITQNLIKNFLDYYRNQNLKKDTILNYERDFNQFFRLFYQS